MSNNYFDLTPTWRGLLPALIEVAVNGTSAEGRGEALRSLQMLADYVDKRNAVLKTNISLLLSPTQHQYLIEVLQEEIAETGDGTAQTILAQILTDKEAK